MSILQSIGTWAAIALCVGTWLPLPAIIRAFDREVDVLAPGEHAHATLLGGPLPTSIRQAVGDG